MRLAVFDTHQCRPGRRHEVDEAIVLSSHRRRNAGRIQFPAFASQLFDPRLMVRSSLWNGRRACGTSSSRKRHDGTRGQSCNNAIPGFARVAEPRTGHQPENGGEVAETSDARGHEDRADGKTAWELLEHILAAIPCRSTRSRPVMASRSRSVPEPQHHLLHRHALRMNAMFGLVKPGTAPTAACSHQCGQILETLRGNTARLCKLQIGPLKWHRRFFISRFRPECCFLRR